MAIGTPTTIGQNAFFAASTTVVLSLSNLPQAGAKLIVCAGCEGAGTTATCTDSQLNTYSADVVANATQNACFFQFSTDQDATALSNTDTITVTLSASRNDRLIAGCYVTGLATGGLDKTQNGNGSGTNPPWSSGATAATTQADELVFGGCLCNATTTPTNTPDAGLTELHDFANTDGVGLFSEYKIVAATGAQTVSGVPTGGNSVWNAAVATYKGAGAVGSPPTSPKVFKPAFIYMRKNT